MSRLVALLIVLGLLSSCSPQKPMPDIAKEKAEIESAITNFENAYQSKDPAAMKKLFSQSDDIAWFGTDSAEVIRGWAQWEKQMSDDWQVFESIKMETTRNLSILVDNDAQLASAIFETPTDVTMAGQSPHMLFRFASTLRKENGEWRFVQGIDAIATVGQSSAEMVAKMMGKKS